MKHISEFIKEQKNLARYDCFRWDEKTVKAFWDFEVEFDSRYFSYAYGRNLVGLFASGLAGKPRNLDYGAGKGFLTECLLERGFKVSCFDLSEATTKTLDARFGDNPNYLGSFSTLGLEQNKDSFDVVWLIEVIEHLEEGMRKVVLHNIYNLLKPDGTLIVSTPNNENLTEGLICNPVTKEIYHRWQHVYSWTAESLTAEIERNGFKTQAVKETELRYEGRGSVLHIKGLVKKLKARIRGRRQGHLLVVAARP